MAMPSHTPMEGTITGFPPAAMTPSLTASAILSRYMCPGMMSLCAQMMPMIGFFISLSVQPSARISERCEDIAVPSEKMLFIIKTPVRAICFEQTKQIVAISEMSFFGNSLPRNA